MQQDSLSSPTFSILIAEDDSDTRFLLKHSLLSLGYQVIEAEDGRRALELCQQQLPHLIITDVMMPNLSGFEFVECFRQECQAFVPVLFLSALAEVADKLEGFAVGGDEYITKPFNIDELAARVRALLRIKELTDQLATRAQELKVANEELLRTQQQLVEKERQLVGVQLAGAAAHSLGQPITAIVLNCRILEKSLPAEINQDAKEAVVAIRSECDQLREIVGKIRTADMNRTEAYLGEELIVELEAKDSRKS